MLTGSFVIFNQVLIMFLLIGSGYVVTKFGLITKRGAKQMSNVLLILVTPAVIINALAIPFDKTKLAGMGIALAVAVIVKIIGVFIGKLLFKKEPLHRQSISIWAIACSNAGFIGLPLTQATLGNEAVIYAAMAVVVSNVFVWTYGLKLMSDNCEKVSLKKIIVNPGIIGTAIGLGIFFFSLSIPPLVHDTIKMLADVNTPLAMIVIGSFIAGANFKSVMTQKNTYLITAMRLIIVPLIIIAILKQFNLSGMLIQACVIFASAPVAANTALFAAKFSKDARFSGELIAFSTVCSILTMPLMLLLVS